MMHCVSNTVLTVQSLEMKLSSKVMPLIITKVIFSGPDYIEGLNS